jgi:hypothetical protein
MDAERDTDSDADRKMDRDKSTRNSGGMAVKEKIAEE